jgi:plasmid maintenance system antidote protein VapI
MTRRTFESRLAEIMVEKYGRTPSEAAELIESHPETVTQGLTKKKARSCAMALSIAQSDEQLVAAWRAGGAA